MSDYQVLFWVMLFITISVTTYAHFLVRHYHKHIKKLQYKNHDLRTKNALWEESFNRIDKAYDEANAQLDTTRRVNESRR